MPEPASVMNRDLCLMAIKDKPSSASEIAEITGIGSNILSGLLLDLYCQGAVDREERPTGAGGRPKFIYTLNDPPKPPRTRPETPARKPRTVKPKVVKAAPVADSGLMFNEIAAPFIEQVTERLLREIIRNLPPIAIPRMIERLQKHLNTVEADE